MSALYQTLSGRKCRQQRLSDSVADVENVTSGYFPPGEILFSSEASAFPNTSLAWADYRHFKSKAMSALKGTLMAPSC